MKLLVGLGNPGDKYKHNRHNIGFLTVDEIAHIHSFGPWKKRFTAAASEGSISGEKCLALKPMTYMNDSGRSVGEAARFYKIPPEDIIVFHDELDIKPGKIKVKMGGGNAGHNGLKSISAHVGNDYVRVRMGIGHPGQKDIVHIYVLQDFAKADRTWLDPLIEAVAKATNNLIDNNTGGFTNDIAKTLQPETKNINKAEKPNQENQTKPQTMKKNDKSSQEANALSEQLKKWRHHNDEPNET